MKPGLPLPLQYANMRRQSDAMGEANDCTVIAYAAATATDYPTAHYILAELAGRQHGSGPNWANYFRAFCLMGYSLRLVEVQARTPITLERELAGVAGRFIYAVASGGHVGSLVDGVPIDWTRGRRHRLIAVWRVAPDTTPRVELPKCWTNVDQFADWEY